MELAFTDPVDVSLTDNANISPQISIAPDNSIHIAWQECLRYSLSNKL
ncbi:MAG: hypothetical protein IPK14_27930 [Blastocatellia bacterium]|nr:hypothetical protein [Blastocatellia bacterium]